MEVIKQKRHGHKKLPFHEARLNKKEMDFLWQAISEPNDYNMNNKLAGNISKSKSIPDKNDRFFNSVLSPLVEKDFYSKWDNHFKYHIEKSEPLPEFAMDMFWVNYQKQYEFNPIHDHGGLYSFVVFMKIPTHWKEQHELPICKDSSAPVASNFQFVFAKDQFPDFLTYNIRLSPEDEGKLLFFPSNLHHQVYPFYGTEEERIAISGNIFFKDELPRSFSVDDPDSPDFHWGVQRFKEKVKNDGK